MSEFTHAQKVHALKYAKIAFGYMRRSLGDASMQTANQQEPIFDAALAEYDRQGAELAEAYRWMEHLRYSVLGFGTEDYHQVNQWVIRNAHLKPAE